MAELLVSFYKKKYLIVGCYNRVVGCFQYCVAQRGFKSKRLESTGLDRSLCPESLAGHPHPGLLVNGVVPLKMKIMYFTHSPCFNPTWLAFLCGTQKEIFSRTSKLLFFLFSESR